ncbi:thiamine biosynthesis protein ApbE [soil metagenome]
MSAVAARLTGASPGGRLHLQHGPIDLIIEAFGAAAEVERAYGQAIDRFGDILPTLVRELPTLRRSIGTAYPLLQGPVARRMANAVWPHRAVYITPMAAVAGAVADEMLQALVAGRTLDKAYVNDGGDIAIHLTPGHELRAGIFAESLDGLARLTFDQPVRGLATSGRGGRSFSCGIADSATVLAATAAAADAAATLIANAVDVDHPAIERRPARDLDPDSDLGDLPVTVAVGKLPQALIDEALDRGVTEARRLRLCGLIEGAALSLFGQWRIDASRALATLTSPFSRRLDRSAKRGAERPSLPDKPHMGKKRSLRSGFQPSVETTEMCDSSKLSRSVK